MIVKTEGSPKSRVKSRTVTYFVGAQPNGSSYSEYINIPNVNRIEYEEGSPHDRTGATNWKSCTHSWQSAKGQAPFVYDAWHTDRPATTRVRNVAYYPDGYNTFQQMAARAVRQVKRPTTAEMLHAAQYVMEGRLNQTLLPITDLVQLARKVDGLGSIDALFTSILAPFRAKPKSFGDLIKKISGADLARKFGFSTLWKTITDTLQVGKVVDNHLRRLERIQNSQQRNFKVSVSDTVETEHGTANVGSYHQNNSVITADYVAGALCQTSIHFRTSVRYDTSDTLRTRLAWDALGLSNLFSTAWDLMPLSFVIDWFVGVQRFVARLESYYFHTVPLERLTELQDVWITSTRKGFVDLNRFKGVRNGKNEGSVVGPAQSYRIECGDFVRYPVDNGAMSLWLPSLKIGGTSLTLAQNITGLELLVQRTF